ncbi:natural resistance-associated macrophage protein [Helicosporidium sp. ATCC 50920]|nr:natural resistance-associated macrophage protein [Helicosporidium sp. ATCC 50920]|eukprot:KDD76936.1 natural resistance-associated macrophage protein [Helicosporidium sp. ATCC 50920]
MDGIGSPSRPPVGVPPSEASESVVGSTAPLRQHGARLNSAKNDSGTDIADGLGGEGPGFMVAMAYIDPGNLASDLNQGSQAGYQLAWVTLWCTVLGFVIQMLSARLGVSTGRHLAQHCREEYPPGVRYALWVIVECGVIACDMIEVIGGAIALTTLSSGAIPLWAGVIVTAATAFLCLLLERLGMRSLEALLFVLIMVMGGTFLYMFFTTGVDYGEVFKGLVIPRLNSRTITFAVGAVGAIIMPHNLYLHSSVVLSRMERVSALSVPRAMLFVRLETGVALFLSVIINVAIIAVFAAAFYGTYAAGTIGLGNAGDYLGQLFGDGIRIIWSVGLLAAANASTVTSTYAGQIIMDGYMNWQISVWTRTMCVRLVTLGPTLLIAVFFRGTDAPFDALTNWLNIVQSLVLPFVLIPLLAFTASERVMGEHANRPWFTWVMGAIAVFLVGLNAYLAVDVSLEQLPRTAWVQALFWMGFAVYVCFVAFIALGMDRARRLHRWAKNCWTGGRERTNFVLAPSPAEDGDVVTHNPVYGATV